LIIGHGKRSQAEQLVAALKADPARILYDEQGAVYKAYSLERVFFSLLQQSAALVIDKQGVVRIAIVANNPQAWLNPKQIHKVNAVLDGLEPLTDD
jgi:hypothetical protein